MIQSSVTFVLIALLCTLSAALIDESHGFYSGSTKNAIGINGQNVQPGYDNFRRPIDNHWARSGVSAQDIEEKLQRLRQATELYKNRGDQQQGGAGIHPSLAQQLPSDFNGHNIEEYLARQKDNVRRGYLGNDPVYSDQRLDAKYEELRKQREKAMAFRDLGQNGVGFDPRSGRFNQGDPVPTWKVQDRPRFDNNNNNFIDRHQAELDQQEDQGGDFWKAKQQHFEDWE